MGNHPPPAHPAPTRRRVAELACRRRFCATPGRGHRTAGRRMVHMLEALMGRGDVGELRHEWHIVRRHAVAELPVGAVLELLAEEESRGHA